MGIVSFYNLRCTRKGLLVLLIILELCQTQDTTRIAVGGRWHLECPKVGYRAEEDRVTVTFTRNNAIWLKIEYSNVTIAPLLMSLHRSRMGTSTILNVVSNNFRYKFYYDEMVGGYGLTITSAEPEDSGTWVCYVTLERIHDGSTDEFTSDGNLIVGKSPPISSTIPDDRLGRDDNEDAYEDVDDQTKAQEQNGGKSKPGRTLHEVEQHSNVTGNDTSTAATSHFRTTSLPIILFSLTIATAAGAF